MINTQGLKLRDIESEEISHPKDDKLDRVGVEIRHIIVHKRKENSGRRFFKIMLLPDLHKKIITTDQVKKASSNNIDTVIEISLNKHTYLY